MPQIECIDTGKDYCCSHSCTRRHISIKTKNNKQRLPNTLKNARCDTALTKTK